jgi:hypothetical protein
MIGSLRTSIMKTSSTTAISMTVLVRAGLGLTHAAAMPVPRRVHP